MKRIIIVVVLLLACVPALTMEFWGSKNSNKFHYPTCQWAQKIKPGNLVKFSSPEDAQKAGYIPCKVCKPPIATKSESDKSNHYLRISAITQKPEPRRGCCSWHGGQCGCDSSGRVICCNGTLSPSCYCW
jgi:hypothetical protein